MTARIAAAALAALGLVAEPRAQTDLSFPQIVVGEAFETIVQVANEVAVADQVVFETFTGEQPPDSPGGDPLAVRFDGGPPATSLIRSLAPFEEITLGISLEGAPLQPGWLRVRSLTPGGKVTAGLFYRVTSNGRVLDSVGVPDTRRQRFARIQFDDRDQGSDTGVALINPEDEGVEVAVDLYQGERQLSRNEFWLGPRQHFARLVREIFPQAEQLAGTLIIETSASRPIPMLTLRVDGSQLTSLAVRPLGMSLQYEVRDSDGVLVESGSWILDSQGLNLEGTGRRDGDPLAPSFPVVGTWRGRHFLCLQPWELSGTETGAVVFNGFSQGEEKSEGVPITGKVTYLDAEGKAVATHAFSAFHKF